jgi:aminoglycoside phosphotransferase (APT) family kinase protein
MQAELDRERLTRWFARQLPVARDLRIEGLERLGVGHSAETLLLTLAWREAGSGLRRDVVLRLRPPPPGLLEPYDLHRQFRILRALESTPVPAPRALWYEGTGEVLGREFYAMERVRGTVYERALPAELASAPERLARMSRSLVETLAAIHRVDLRATGLDALGDGRDHLRRELDHWAGEMRRVQRGPLPALERLRDELRLRMPEPSRAIALVHGDAKPGNFAFEGDRVVGVFDWEMASIGDPLCDVGWAEFNWTTPNSLTHQPGALTRDEFAALYEELTGIAVRQREWYRALGGYKMLVIMLVASMLFDAGSSDDPRFAQMGMVVPHYTARALAELGIDGELESGPVAPRPERLRVLERGIA